jgi:hypothetical protein
VKLCYFILICSSAAPNTVAFEPHGAVDLEIGNQPGHPPEVEVAFTRLQVGTGVFFAE